MGSRLRLEIRKNMETGSLILGGLEGKRFPIDISVSQSALQIQSPDSCDKLHLPQEVKLVPSTCRYVQHVSGEGLHVRMKAHVDYKTENTSTVKEILKCQEEYTFYCQSCGAIIVHQQQFLRVLPLPTENWSSLVEEWCCHPDPFANRRCLPKVNDCFLGDTFLLVNKANISDPPGETNEMSAVPHPVDANVSKSKENTKVVCQRCKAVLGESMSSDTIQYYITEIMIRPSCHAYTMISRNQFVESMIVQILLKFSSSRSTFRFCVQGQNGKLFLLLWLLNVDTVLIESTSSGRNNSYFFSGNASSDSSQSLEVQNCARLLYIPCIDKSHPELEDKWMNETGAHSLTFPSRTCLELILLLSLNNASLPHSLRFMNEWQVAYLKI
ncbi:E3 ubiquitin-protein ligase E3D isoform X2 [Rana temporaria]|uniref:E3 ubiquitin-protein ligase E3D isoform X2 n=1 Tax=Rana temporaria TaxID=8407 RepID=UPI001AADC4DA|nr:E3 ubiquitin-protein ligase E3D isoform X2 [Rana temporaria]